MKLTGELKEKVEKAENTEETRKLIEEAGFELTDDEVDEAVGGGGIYGGPKKPQTPRSPQGIV